MAEVEETIKRILAHRGVLGYIIVNSDGIAIRTSFDNTTTLSYVGNLYSMTMKAKSSVRDIDPTNELHFFRMRTKKYELLVAPDSDYLLIVVQNPECGTL